MKPFLYRGRARLLVFLSLPFLLSGCATGPRGYPAREGIANFDAVDSQLYRGAQPDQEGLETLQRRGIKTVINLRQTNDLWQAEAELVRAAGITYTNIPMSGFHRPTEEQVLTVLALIEAAPAPVFIHCKLGCDRTGTIIACHRLRHDGWTAAAALREAKAHGMSAWVFGMRRFIKDFAADQAANHH